MCGFSIRGCVYGRMKVLMCLVPMGGWEWSDCCMWMLMELWGEGGGGAYGRCLWEVPVGGACGRCLWEVPVGGAYGSRK